MSYKKGHLESFYLIDADEYQTISELRNKCSQLEKKLADALKYQDLATSAKETHLHAKIGSLQEELKKHKSQKVTSETYEPNTAEQVGSGFDDTACASTSSQSSVISSPSQIPSAEGSILTSSDDDFRKTLLASFERFLSAQLTQGQIVNFPKPNIDQRGSGVTDDLTPTLPISVASPAQNSAGPGEIKHLEETGEPKVAAQVPETKEATNSLNDVDERLVMSVPASSRPKAIKLLSELKNIPSEFSFDNTGSITINGKVVPNANFFEIFPSLYQHQKKKRPIDSALSVIVNELASLGFGHLIQRSFTAGLLPRGQKYLKDRQSAKGDIAGNWYYLGQNDK